LLYWTQSYLTKNSDPMTKLDRFQEGKEYELHRS
jgi:hypothetical protein